MCDLLVDTGIKGLNIMRNTDDNLTMTQQNSYKRTFFWIYLLFFIQPVKTKLKMIKHVFWMFRQAIGLFFKFRYVFGHPVFYNECIR